jgi:hypothetical protein
VNPKLYFFYGFILVVSIAIIASLHQTHPNETGKFISIDSDGKGYYAYLPALFIDRNISTLPKNTSYTNEINGLNVIKYPPGTALMQSPFFCGALIYIRLSQDTIDGKEFPFQIAIQAAALFYLLLGLCFTFRIIMSFGLKKQAAVFAVTILFFATNLLYYSLFKAAMSHVYSFTAISGFAFFAQSFIFNKKLKWLLLAAMSLAIVVLIRPFNLIIVLLIPLFTRDINDLKLQFNFLLQKPRWIILAVLIVFVLVFFQPLMWYLQTDQWFLWSYKDEGFYFLRPEIFNVLFSFNKGLFVYSPVLLLTIPGLIILSKRNKWQAFWMLGFMLLLIYLISCWWNWYFGDGFGHRAFIDFFVLFALLIALVIDKIKGIWRLLIIFFSIGTIGLNLLQTYQYRIGILAAHSMNADKYKFIILKTSSDYIHVMGGNTDIIPFSKSKPELYLQVTNNFETEQKNWEVGNRVLSPRLNNKQNHAAKFNGDEFGLKFNLPYEERIAGCKKLWAEVSLSRYDSLPQSSMGTLLVIDKRNIIGENLHYHSFALNDIPSQTAQQIDTFSYSFEMPCLSNENEFLSIYLWNQKKGHFEIDVFSITIYRIE